MNLSRTTRRPSSAIHGAARLRFREESFFSSSRAGPIDGCHEENVISLSLPLLFLLSLRVRATSSLSPFDGKARAAYAKRYETRAFLRRTVDVHRNLRAFLPTYVALRSPYGRCEATDLVLLIALSVLPLPHSSPPAAKWSGPVARFSAACELITRSSPDLRVATVFSGKSR